ncbi:mismatch-specific DNA-glycosylase [Peribacillus cavernae]|uniref:Mismatch-specific DNA-glycosylase n=1 Tax=Peribacillus cavernae TaxID=1674310 RepID=A0A3S0VFB8_9BACI|nr:mismatch-specific DNA-glycosylase [Peribacillus cavernae]MDQ0218839.1 TDG/mug DNA glycosylase family protein [Peribacillus cavernae]RUQ31044.1 mismatch-specific DNA-glycosylase [Peribacillus cavernae]
MNSISDHMNDHLDILFVGFNPSIRSGETGHHYANPNNRFWRILHEAGITPKKYRHEEDEILLDLGYGFTNIVSRPTKTAEEILKAEYKEGREELKKKIAHFKPKVICFVGKGVYQQYSGLKVLPWGVQEHSVVSGTIDFVAPSSSGLVRMKMEEVIKIYSHLPELLRSLKAGKND